MKKMSKNQHDELVKWLKQPCKYSDDLYKDPGYSGYYLSKFGIYDKNSIIYRKNDIDNELNVGFNEILDPNFDIYDESDINMFIDYIPSNINSDDINDEIHKYPLYSRKHIQKKLERKCMVILPGSNHSNANFLFKSLNDVINKKFRPYKIPYVQSDPTIPYMGEHKDAKIFINKEAFYNFIYKHS